jgi:putative endonuclease
MAVTYILRCKDGTLYTGATKDMDRRLKEHNSGKASKYTSGRRPLKLIYVEECNDYSGALKREKEIQKMSRKEKDRLVNRKKLKKIY